MRSILLKILRKAIRLIEKKQPNEVVKEDAILQNVFNTNFQKKVLISYLKKPFLEGIKYHHTNYLECYTAAEAFHELGFGVDVIDLMEENTLVPYADYSVVYGLGFALENAFHSEYAEHIKKIFYSTGYNPFYAYRVSLLQVENFYGRNKKLIPQSSRVQSLFWANQYLLSDLVIALGNNAVANSYLETNKNINVHSISAFYFDVYDIDLNKKNFANASKNFLWFGSSGLLHKGLDLIIDIFANRNDISLHICGADKNERKFLDFYNPIIEKCDNIFEHGFIPLQSSKFNELMNLCAYTIFPSASEGGSPALLNVMANGGLIPIATKTCGVDIKELGFEIEELSEKGILKQIEEVILLSTDIIKEKSENVKTIVKSIYTYDSYKTQLSRLIKEELSSN